MQISIGLKSGTWSVITQITASPQVKAIQLKQLQKQPTLYSLLLRCHTINIFTYIHLSSSQQFSPTPSHWTSKQCFRLWVLSEWSTNQDNQSEQNNFFSCQSWSVFTPEFFPDRGPHALQAIVYLVKRESCFQVSGKKINTRKMYCMGPLTIKAFN